MPSDKKIHHRTIRAAMATDSSVVKGEISCKKIGGARLFDDTQRAETLGQLLYGIIHLLLGVGGHEGYAH